MEKTNDTKRQILREAQKLFFTEGYKKTTLRKIASACGRTHSGIFNHYKGKAKIAAAVIERYIRLLIECYVKRFGSFENFSLRADRYYWMLHFSFLNSHPNFSKLYAEFYEADRDVFITVVSPFISNKVSPRASRWDDNTAKLVYLTISDTDHNIAELLVSGEIPLDTAVNFIMSVEALGLGYDYAYFSENVYGEAMLSSVRDDCETIAREIEKF